MTYRLVYSTGSDVVTRTVNAVEDIIPTIAQDTHIAFSKTNSGVRITLRWWMNATQHPVWVWQKLDNTTWASRDIEDILDDETQTPRWPIKDDTLSFYLRMTGPRQEETTTTHTTIPSIFQSITKTWQYPAPIAKGYTRGLIRTEAEPCDFALSARLGDSLVAMHLPLLEVEAGLGTGHEALELQHRINKHLFNCPY